MMTKTRTVLSAAVAAALVGTAAQAAPDYEATPDWTSYRSAMTKNMPIDRSFNDVDVTKTDRSQSTDDSYNTRTDVDAKLDLDASRNAYDSFNRSKEIDTDITKKTNTEIGLEFDKSYRADGSYNTDNSARDASTNDSYNSTDNSIRDSYNKHLDVDVERKDVYDSMGVNPTLSSAKKQLTGDQQNGANSGYLGGHTQGGYQGGVDVGGIGNDAPTSGGWGSMYGYGVDARHSENQQAIRVDGPNLGAVSNTSVVNQGRDLVFGPNRSAIGNDFGNKQIFSAGDQAQLQSVEQLRQGNNQAAATDQQTTSATKASSVR